jgi:capsular polysaccharide transport system permease protein
LGAAPQVSILAQDCILRREALAKLDAGLGAIGHWRDPAADPPLRLAPDASMVDALARRRGAVTVCRTRADSLIRVEASGPDPAIAQAISTALIGCAGEVVDGLSAHMRSNRPAAASGRPTQRWRAAHQDAARLQKGLRVFLAETGGGSERAVIHAPEMEREAPRGPAQPCPRGLFAG